MTGRPFSIRLFLPDGDPSGRRIAVRSHHTAEIYFVSRAQFPTLSDDDVMKRTGVYVLVGPSEDESFEQKMYIGQAGRLGPRIKDHLSGTKAKDWWTSVFLLTKTDGELDQADVDHLEAHLIDLARSAARLEVENAQSPKPAPLAAYKGADVAAFLEDVLPIYKALGLTAFEPGPEQASGITGSTPSERTLLLLEAVGVSGKAHSTREGFVVLAGSTLRVSETETIPSRIRRRRQQLLDEELVESAGPDKWRLKANETFRSPSEAAGVITGSSVSGPQYWRTASGTPLGELEYANATAAEPTAPE